ncbi:nitroreductase family protein [uncultured Actinomyces sp.]|uniref:nitroreductase family protein n=1 Tax=uncultured Actinomyces sp. TaxID=249061 RepID=UPI00262658FC|nr:nitroreductase family protein [uncultured Actinomyces sp.]
MSEVLESLSAMSQFRDELNAREVLAELFNDAHTAYTFTDEPVTDEQLRAAYDLAKWAPTGVNGQPLRVAVVRAGAVKQQLLNALPCGNREQAVVRLWYWCAVQKWISITIFPHCIHVVNTMKSF